MKKLILFVTVLCLGLYAEGLSASADTNISQPVTPPIVKPETISKPDIKTYTPQNIQTHKQLSSSPIGELEPILEPRSTANPTLSKTSSNAPPRNYKIGHNTPMTYNEYSAKKQAEQTTDFGPYMREVQRKIKANWNPPKSNLSKKVVVMFDIGKNGQLLSCRILESSGDKSVDAAALRALNESVPFRPLPQTFKGDKVSIQFTFDYKVHTNKPTSQRTNSTQSANVPRVRAASANYTQEQDSLYKERQKILSENETYKKDISRYQNTVRVMGISGIFLIVLVIILGCLSAFLLYRRYSAPSLPKDVQITKIEEEVEEETGKIIYTERTVDVYDVPRNIIIKEKHDYFWLVGLAIIVLAVVFLYLYVHSRMKAKMENNKNKYIIDLVEDLAKQAFELMPKEIDNDTKIYIKNAIVYYPKIIGETIIKDNNSITEAELEYIVQIPAEWIYHKMVDLYRSNVGREHWECIINAVINAFIECLTDLGYKDLGNRESLNKVEAVVISAYDSKLQELLNNSLISEETYEETKKHSNIDELAQEVNQQNPDNDDSPEKMFAESPIKAVIAFFLISVLVTAILVKINLLFRHVITFVRHLILFMQVNLPVPMIVKNNLKYIFLWIIVLLALVVLAKLGSKYDKKEL